MLRFLSNAGVSGGAICNLTMLTLEPARVPGSYSPYARSHLPLFHLLLGARSPENPIVVRRMPSAAALLPHRFPLCDTPLLVFCTVK